MLINQNTMIYVFIIIFFFNNKKLTLPTRLYGVNRACETEQLRGMDHGNEREQEVAIHQSIICQGC